MMGEIVGAGLLSHVPTIMLSKEIRYELNEGKEISLIPGFDRIRKEVLDVLKPDVVIVLDTHWGTLVEYVVTSHARRAGKYTSEELPRGMHQVPYDLKGDPDLANAMAEEVNKEGVRCSAIDDPYLPIHYPTINLAHYLEQGEAWISVSCAMTAGADENLAVGRGIANAIAKSGKKVVILASGSMSHTFYPFNELHLHESSDPKHIFSDGAREADYERLAWFKQGDHASVINNMDDYYQYKPEGRFAHYLMMVGALGSDKCKAIGRQFSDYENSVGTSQVHVWFDRPEEGWS
ncbi:MAG: 3,4-dihydroxyphenylacetate 2,3-dioxygenase [Bermanella sp.]|jgi:3,4-dihydroxyphenylacetate 2,3-dioxygenase|uniref:DODA-type extradiol aromatic ring-opening family dioxygenase n=1 Tax=Glaciecola sp. 33A TaxID=2057807 RepID=UPI0018E3C74B|nr:catechol 1,2-dioxygenase [Glaciecola sp. 33A]